MKSLKFKIMALIMAVMLISVGFTAAIGCGGDKIEYKSATVTSVTGDGRVHRGDGSLPAYAGLTIRHGDTLQTEAGSTVAVRMGDGRYALIEPSTSVKLDLYESKTESVALVTLVYGAVYIEADSAVPDGMTFGVAVAPMSPKGVRVLDAYALGGGAAYRVETTDAKPSTTTVQAIIGAFTLSLPATGRDGITVTEGHECRLERDGKGMIRFPTNEAETDPYSLPDRYIALDAEGLFDVSGNLIQRPPSGDLSLREISVKRADGTSVPLIPEFDNAVAGYVVETDQPLTLTVTANHRRTRLEIQCHTASAVRTEGSVGEVTFREDEPFHAVSILVIAENGSSVRFSVNIVPTEG